jgi:hypothetical protein
MSVRHVFLVLSPSFPNSINGIILITVLCILSEKRMVINGGKSSYLLHKYSEYKLAVNAIVLYQTAA